MWEESAEKKQPLRTGLTTGTCATACSAASAIVLLTHKIPTIVSVTLPKGKTVELNVNVQQNLNNQAYASTVKDAGDDPDVTHGATVFVELQLTTEPGILFYAGEGVGIVTRPGLLLDVGEPAINPVPRRMISENLQAIAQQNKYSGGFSITVGVVNGEGIAQKTMNPRLGILGGLSILGTTGIVRPFSCAAWIASIHQGIDVAKANGIDHIAASTGNSSENAIKNRYNLSEIALIEMGDFAAAVFKHLKKSPIKKLSICGGFGKITKLANGHMDLNSRVSSIDFDQIAGVAADLGASLSLQRNIKSANTSIEALNLCLEEQIELANAMCERALSVTKSKVPASVSVEVFAINRHGEFTGSASDDQVGES